MKKFFYIIFSLIFALCIISCNNAFDALASVGSALGGTSTNLFGLGKDDAKATADATSSLLFGDQSSETSTSGILKTEPTTTAINGIFSNTPDGYKANAPAGLKDESGKIDYNIAFDAYLKGFMLTEDEFNKLLSSVSEIKSDATRKAFATNMATPFYKDGEQPIPKDAVKVALDDFKEVIDDIEKPVITKFITALLDGSIDKEGNLTKAGVLMIAATATTVDKVFSVGAELQGVAKEDFDINALSGEQQKELAKAVISDVKNLHTILLTAVGYDSDTGKALNDLITGSFVF